MKSTTLTAIILTLLMLLLVLFAAFVFSVSRQRDLSNQQRDLNSKMTGAEQNIESLLIEAGALEQNNEALATRVSSMQLEQATAESAGAAQAQDLADANQRIASLEAEADLLSQERAGIELTRDFYELVGPIVTIVEPQNLAVTTVGEDLQLVIIASDPVGVEKVTITINDGPEPTKPIELNVELPGSSPTSHRFTHTWTPQNARLTRITVRAVNGNDNQGRQPAEIIVDVQELPATSTPTATATATVAAVITPLTAEATPTP